MLNQDRTAIRETRVCTIFSLFQFVGEAFHIEYLTDLVQEWQEKERGSFPTPIECMIIVWVFSCMWRDIKEVYETGLR